MSRGPSRGGAPAGDTARREPDAACLVCGPGDEPRLLFELANPIVECRACGLVYARQDALEPATQRYGEHYFRGHAYPDYLGGRKAIHQNARRALAELESQTSGRRLLDVGCATGFFLEEARTRGWECWGLEVSPYASEYGRRELGLRIFTGSIEEPPAELPRVDVITMWDIIEHLARPDLALERARHLLRPGGVLAITTGDYRSLIRRVLGRHWRLFSDATHLFFFDARTLGVLLGRAGFRRTRLSRRGKLVGLPMILHQSGLPFAERLIGWLTRRGWHPSLYVNLWDVMTLYAVPVEAASPGGPAPTTD